MILSAQNPANKVAMELGVIKNEYFGDVGNRLFNFSDNYFATGLGLIRYINPSLNVGVESTLGRYGYYYNDADINNVWKMKGNKFDLSVIGVYKLNNGYIMPESNKFSPFVSLGIGIASYSEIPSIKATGVAPFENPMIITKGIDFIVPMGIGFNLKLSKSVNLLYKYTFNFTTTDYRDMIRTSLTDPNDMAPGFIRDKYLSVTGPDAFGKHMLGISFTLSSKADEDNDGIPDDEDLCLFTPPNVPVDKTGCPMDTDGDGIEDYMDKCNDTPKGVQVNANGCPNDADNDGVPDYLDKCPDTPARVKVDSQGCPPDQDKDGVPDHLDKCKNTPPGVEVNADGCVSDEDNDGIPDGRDLCPCTPTGVKVAVNGCPVDTDCDGVPDYKDSCPDVAGDGFDGCIGTGGGEGSGTGGDTGTEGSFENATDTISREKIVGIQIDGKTLELDLSRITVENNNNEIRTIDENLDDAINFLRQYKEVRIKNNNRRYTLSVEELVKKLKSSKGRKSKSYLLIIRETL